MHKAWFETFIRLILTEKRLSPLPLLVTFLPFMNPPNPPLPYPSSLLPLYTPHSCLYGWDGKQFDEHYYCKLDKLWYHWKSAREEAYSKED